ncbi:MAG: hypothetical protein JWM58_3170 [Rhizobium sp.]|nr:hypothetical protein [Rhizobium sp.]
MKPKIILHCGAPKTGSTSFQHLLYNNSEILAKAGFYFPSVSRKKRMKDDIRILLREILRPENHNQAFLYRIHEVLQVIYAETGAHTLIISNEDMLGRPFSRKYRTFYQRADEMADRIKLVLEDYDVEARFVIRDYSGFLPSWYVQSVRMGSKLTLEQFLRVYDFHSVTWKTPVQALRTHFGTAKVGIYDHADLVKDPHAFLSAMFPDVMAALGEKGRELPSKNISIGSGMVNLYRRWNEISDRLTPNSSARRTVQYLGRRYALLPFERFSKSEKLRLPQPMAEALSARYRDDALMINPRRIRPNEDDAFRYAAQ